MTIKRWKLAVLAVLCALPARAATLEVFAAASLKESFQDIGKRFETDHPGDTVDFNFAGSNVLRTQIEQGAPADVFASADVPTMQAIHQGGNVGKAAVFAHNKLVVVTPPDSSIRKLTDLTRPEIKIVLAGPDVPAGRYADQALKAMDDAGSFGSGFQTRVMTNVVSRETNVRVVLSKVTLGEADAGFVYATDAVTVKGKVAVLAIPERFSPTAIYPIAVVSGSKQKALASEFIKLVRSHDGKAILSAHGFRP